MNSKPGYIKLIIAKIRQKILNTKYGTVFTPKTKIKVIGLIY